ncbi:MAG: hypothetical protein WBE26_00625 [Phycisphaerae bacterium]
MTPPHTRQLDASDGLWLTLCVVSLICHAVLSDGVRAFLREAYRLCSKL